MPKKQTTPKSKFQTYPIQTVISRVFDPPIIIMLLTVYAVLQSNISTQGVMIFTLLVPLLFGIPLAFFVWKLKTHQVSNWDISNRKERIVPLMALLGFLFIDIIIVAIFNNVFLLNVFILYFLWVFGFFVITLVWKISGHTGITTLAAMLLYRWIGPQVWYVFLAVPLVAWARISRKDHTWFQAIAGIVYSVIIVEVWSYLFP